ncbi:hypothetical protein ACOMHN_042836 [Nucella lapillus]
MTASPPPSLPPPSLTRTEGKGNQLVDFHSQRFTFLSLKSRPGPAGANVVLRRKENGNWTLRERSQHNAQRHMQQIFRAASSPLPLPPTPQQ